MIQQERPKRKKRKKKKTLSAPEAMPRGKKKKAPTSRPITPLKGLKSHLHVLSALFAKLSGGKAPRAALALSSSLSSSLSRVRDELNESLSLSRALGGWVQREEGARKKTAAAGLYLRLGKSLDSSAQKSAASLACPLSPYT